MVFLIQSQLQYSKWVVRNTTPEVVLCVVVLSLMTLSISSIFYVLIFYFLFFNPIQDRLKSKICHTYSKMVKLGTIIPYLKKIQKIYNLHKTPLEFWWHQHFFTWNHFFFCCIKKYRYRLHFNTSFLIL